jgi:ribosomal protein S18 acetylase RimI-like enzyme
MPNLKTTIADHSDIEAVASMFDLYRQFYDQKRNLEAATAFIAARIQNGDSVILITKNSAGVSVGFCQLYPTFCSVEAAPIYTLYDLFVHPDFRRTGAGRALLLAAEDHAKINGRVRMDLTTAKDNTSAQALYESLGWVRDNVFYTYNRRIDAAKY